MHSDLEHSPIVTQRLRELPAELAPPLSWEEFQPRMAERFAESRSTWRYAALAAGIAAFVAGLAMWSRVSSPSRSTNAPTAQSNIQVLSLPDQQTISQAQAAERWLARLPTEPAVVRVGIRGAATDLEDRIAWMDDALSVESLDPVNPTHLAALRQERARLINSLVQVRYAETLAANVP